MPSIAQTIPELFRQAVADVPDSTWLVGEGSSLSYVQALEGVERVGAGLRAAGVGPGDRVLVTPRTTTEHVLAWLGVMEVGAVQVPVNPSSTPDELAALVAQATPTTVVTDADLRPAVDAVLARAGSAATVVEVADLLAAPGDGRGPTPVDPDSVAVMIPTSGTTGRSKLVMQTHRSYVMAGEGFPAWVGLTAADRLMTSLPLFHVNAPAYSILGSVAARASLAVLPRFSASRFLDDARRFRATEFNAIGAMLEILMRQPERPDDADNPLRLCYSALALPRERHEAVERRFGFEITCGYGLSESMYGLVWPRGERPFGALGVARQHPRLGHVNDARVRAAGPDGVGELELRNPATMVGYHEMPEESAAVLVDGWLRTGDLVRVDDHGVFTFVGRAKEVIRRRGENLSPSEVEAALVEHPDVAEAAVIGVPSELSEQDVKAFVVPAADRSVDAAVLAAFVAERLARFKVPRYVEVVTDLPRTATGRVAKHRLEVERTATEVDLDAPPDQGSGITA